MGFRFVVVVYASCSCDHCCWRQHLSTHFKKESDILSAVVLMARFLMLLLDSFSLHLLIDHLHRILSGTRAYTKILKPWLWCHVSHPPEISPKLERNQVFKFGLLSILAYYTTIYVAAVSSLHAGRISPRSNPAQSRTENAFASRQLPDCLSGFGKIPGGLRAGGMTGLQAA